MAKIMANEGENFESLLKRFTRKVQQDGIISEARRRKHYQKPISRRRRKEVASRRAASKLARAIRKR